MLKPQPNLNTPYQNSMLTLVAHTIPPNHPPGSLPGLLRDTKAIITNLIFHNNFRQLSEITILDYFRLLSHNILYNYLEIYKTSIKNLRLTTLDKYLRLRYFLSIKNFRKLLLSFLDNYHWVYLIILDKYPKISLTTTLTVLHYLRQLS